MSTATPAVIVNATKAAANNATRVVAKAGNNAAAAVVNAAAGAATVAQQITTQVSNALKNSATNAAAAAAAATATATEGGSWFPIIIAVLVALAIALIAWFSGTLGDIRNKIANRPSPENNIRIADTRAAEQTRIADSIALEHSPILESAGGAVSAKPDPAAAGLADMPDDEEALLNFHVLGARNAGYMGPYENGVFDETRAIRLALRKGVRLFILEIDYLSRDPEMPVLVCRDKASNLISNNTGSIRRVAQALKTFTKDQAAAGTDPILLVLSVRRLPTPKPAAGATDPENLKARLRFMANIASQLEPIYQWMLKGDYAQQKGQDQLFKQPIATFQNAFIMLTNLDTRIFRQSSLPVYITTKQDLDVMINARIYATQTEGGPPGYGTPAQSDIAVSAHANTYDYYKNIPAANLDGAKTTAMNTWSLALSPNGTAPPTAADLELLMDRIGVQGIAVDIFADQGALVPLYAPKRFKKFSYVGKPAGSRFKQAATVSMGAANPATNTDGGNLSVPKP